MANAKKKKPSKPRSAGGRYKNKGSNYERRICKQLSLWWTGGERDDVFWRTAISGGRATFRAKKGCRTANSAGDICSLDHIGDPFTEHFLVELKKGYSRGSERIDILKLIDSPNSKKSILLLQWWLKAKKEMKFAGRKETWIIFERDRGKSILMTRGDYIKRLNRETSGLPYPHPIINALIGMTFTFTTLENFLSYYRPEQVII